MHRAYLVDERNEVFERVGHLVVWQGRSWLLQTCCCSSVRCAISQCKWRPFLVVACARWRIAGSVHPIRIPVTPCLLLPSPIPCRYPQTRLVLSLLLCRCLFTNHMFLILLLVSPLNASLLQTLDCIYLVSSSLLDCTSST